MSPLAEFDEALRDYLNRDITSTALLAACATYIGRQGDWREVVGVLRDDLGYAKQAVIDWFVALDEPDLAEQVLHEWDDLAAEG